MCICLLLLDSSDKIYGGPMEGQEVIPVAQYETSSRMDGVRNEHAALYSDVSWCAHPTDTAPFVMVCIS